MQLTSKTLSFDTPVIKKRNLKTFYLYDVDRTHNKLKTDTQVYEIKNKSILVTKFANRSENVVHKLLKLKPKIQFYDCIIIFSLAKYNV